MLSPATLLERHPSEAVRLVALDWLAHAVAARGRLADHGDAEALHDFRVAIRRLRSTVKAFRRELGESVSKRSRQRLRRVAAATNVGRDAEVQLEWLDGHRASLYSRHRPGAAWFRDRLRRRKEEADARLHAEVTRDFDKVCATLRRKLPAYTLALRVGDAAPAPRFADALATRIREAAADLSARLGEVTGPAASDAAHEARIAAKRVRYLLEPVSAAVDGAPGVVKRLKQLQEALGELHDLDVVIAELGDAIGDASREQDAASASGAEPPNGDPPNGAASEAEPVDGAAESPASSETTVVAPVAAPPRAPNASPTPNAPNALDRDPRPGLACLARRGRSRRETLYEELEGQWFAGAAAPFLAALERVAQTLSAPPAEPEPVPADAGPPMEIERKYLLRALPPRVHDLPFDDVEQGWLPGERLRERVRRVRSGITERYFRTVKLGAGVARVELEEETTADLWSALWPLTARRRIAKRRYYVREGDLTWEIDDFAGRTLVVAEIELPDAAIVPAVPEWLAPYVVREVTDEPAFTNHALAASS